MAKKRVLPPATQVRRALGLSVAEAARRAQISQGYLRRVERDGASYLVARRLSRLYQCPVEVFLPAKHGKGGPRTQ